MTSHRVRIRLIPRGDPAFRAAFERGCVAASLTGVDIDTPDAALIAEDHLHLRGYPNAEISLVRTVEDYRSRASTWFVRRDRLPSRNVAPTAQGRIKGRRSVGPQPGSSTTNR